LLKEQENLQALADRRDAGTRLAVNCAVAQSGAHTPFLRIPPFPGARLRQFAERPGGSADPYALIASLRELRVGGSFWGAQPELPTGHVLVRSAAALSQVKQLMSERPVVLWDLATQAGNDQGTVSVATGDCDPWHMLSGASALVAEADDEVCAIAALLGIPCYDFELARTSEAVSIDRVRLIVEALCGASFENPFTGEAMDALAVASLCGFWRQLIDSNRGIVGGIGFAFWKQGHVAPLLWDGSSPFRFLRNLDHTRAGDSVAIWRAKVAPGILADLERGTVSAIEVEDGFLRSQGLGADCIPPLSIAIDRLGLHFDPSRPSELEVLLQEGRFDQRTQYRARHLRRLIVQAGIGKYERGSVVVDRRVDSRRHILVPGQVEDDRAVLAGGCGLVSNLELLSRVRERAPDAYILYKPHPDVLAGHRRGVIPDSDCLRFADEIVGKVPVASLISMVDEVHVNTSLAGFEALMRGKKVTTYGVPFYAGWGLTDDLGPVPARRTAKRTLDELVAATLLIYPRYLDPVTGLPCPAEVAVARLSVSDDRMSGFIVGMRRLQGKFMRRLRSLVQ
jgi:capsular polysaccharide export protein